MTHDIITAVILSLRVGVTCFVLGTTLAMPLGYILARWNFAGKTLVATICFLPALLPPVVTGWLILQVFDQDSVLGTYLNDWGWHIPFTYSAVVLSALVVGWPYYVMGARTAFSEVDRRYEEMSYLSGFGPWQTFIKVTLPLAAPGIVGGGIIGFARSFGEFGATIVVAGNMEGKTRTIALAIYTLMETPHGEQKIWYLIAFSVGFVAIALIIFEFINRWQRRRLSDY